MDGMWREYIKEKVYKVEEYTRCGSESGGKVSKPGERSIIPSEPIFHTRDLFL